MIIYKVHRSPSDNWMCSSSVLARANVNYRLLLATACKQIGYIERAQLLSSFAQLPSYLRTDFFVFGERFAFLLAVGVVVSLAGRCPVVLAFPRDDPSRSALSF